MYLLVVCCTVWCSACCSACCGGVLSRGVLLCVLSRLLWRMNHTHIIYGVFPPPLLLPPSPPPLISLQRMPPHVNIDAKSKSEEGGWTPLMEVRSLIGSVELCVTGVNGCGYLWLFGLLEGGQVGGGVEGCVGVCVNRVPYRCLPPFTLQATN